MGSEINEMMTLGLTEPLRVQVQRKFAHARTAGHLLFSDTELAILQSRKGVPVSSESYPPGVYKFSPTKFQLRFCPALAVKPKEKVPDWSKPKSKVDPFADPSPELLVNAIPKDDVSHILVLNKFPVIPNHFIIATKANQPQTDILAESDLNATYACIQAWKAVPKNTDDGSLFGFFNSGEHSGASQVHRHLQFLPTKDIMIGSKANHDWDLLIHSMTSKAHPRLPLLYSPALPFIHFATKLETEIAPSSLYSKYLMLMKAALAASTNKFPNGRLEDVEIERHGQTTFSYNLALTTNMMAICPRKSESAPIPGLDNDHDVSINGTILGGTLMVKNEQEWHTLKQNPHALDVILEAIGFPWPSNAFVHSNNRL